MISGKATLETPLLEVDGVTVSYRLPSQRMFRLARAFRAVDGVSLAVARGESLGLVGETGCGKSSLARAVYGLAPVAGGAVRFEGMDLANATGAERRAIRRSMQMIFQDPGGSLNPRMRVGPWWPSRWKSTAWATGERAGTGSSRCWRRWGSRRATPPAIHTS